jgi:LmbE family N-acetylglucosaminyl deacetylase
VKDLPPLEPEILGALPRGRVLVLAPHADDEVLGVGGTLALHALQGDEVHVLVVFDGAQGLPIQGEARVRREEALAGAAHLGIGPYTFWDYPENHEPSNEQLAVAAARLEEHLRRVAPAIVYAPWRGEQHRDHRSLAQAARAALSNAKFDGQAWAYEVWTPLAATRLVDVTSTFERKLAALAEHRSQLAHTDLVRMTSGLSALRAALLPGRDRCAEAFAPFCSSAQDPR